MMSEEPTLKFKFTPTLTLARLYEDQGLINDALKIYKYLNTLPQHDLQGKIDELLAKPGASETQEAKSLADMAIQGTVNIAKEPISEDEKETSITNDDSKSNDHSDEQDNSASLDIANDEEVISSDSPTESKEVNLNLPAVIPAEEASCITVPEFDYLINIIFNDEEKEQLNIVPTKDFVYQDKVLKHISELSKELPDEPIEETHLNINPESEIKEIIDDNNEIGSEVTVQDFIALLLTYYSRSTKVSDINIGDLFLLLSSIKLEK